jgi:hypothetical protein
LLVEARGVLYEACKGGACKWAKVTGWVTQAPKVGVPIRTIALNRFAWVGRDVV